MFSARDLRALRRRDGGAIDADALVRLAPVQRMFRNSLTVSHLDPGNHLLGTCTEWSLGPDGAPLTREINIVPAGQQTFENFQQLTLWIRYTPIDELFTLTNNAEYACFYEVYRLLENGVSQQETIVNPWPGARAVYAMNPGQKLVVTPVSMVRYVLAHDPKLTCLDAHASAQETGA
jgi:hypothetical protein